MRSRSTVGFLGIDRGELFDSELLIVRSPGGTPSMFEQLLNLQQVRGMLSAVDLNQDLALLCINDDVTRDDDEISKYFRSWQGRRWSRAATWESDVRH